MAAANISNTDYAKHTRALINLITALRALGAQADFDLPRIAVIGNQSAGKSSLIEAISGITVPRSSGTCTRCPMECRLIHSPHIAWQCQVLLRIETDENGKKVSAKEIPFGPLLHHKGELEEMLRRAQLAILNPSVPPSFFVDFDTKSLKPGEKPQGSVKQLAFSNNVVCIDLKGPDVTDLSFIDLPGIISNVASGEDRGNIAAVQNMVKEHIKGNTLILLTITMRDDIDNQGAAFLAREADEKGLRTIGVLTKPDLIQPGEEHGWLMVLNGEAHQLKHGYYVTKQPSPKELEEKISFETAREREATFFDVTHPWNTNPDLRRRMGTPNLTKELSRLLGNVINQALPALRKESKQSNQKVKEDLDSLPPPPSENPAAELLSLVTSFSNKVENLIEGREYHEALIRKCRPAYKTFKTDIRRTAPRMRPFVDPNVASAPQDIDFEDVSLDGDTISNADSEDDPLPQPTYLNDVRDHIERSLTRQLPYNVPFAAKVALIERFFADWESYCQKCFFAVYEVTLTTLKELVDSHFGHYNTALPDHVHGLVEQLVEHCRSATLQRIEWMLKLEDPPFTNNDHYFSVYRETYLTKYREARKPKDVIDAHALTQALTALAAIGYTGLTKDDLPKLTGADEYEEELLVMAETSAYFHVAYKRIIDNVPRIIDHDFLRAIGKQIQTVLIAGLSLGTEQATDRANAYLAEDPDVGVQRAYLKEKKARLDGVLKKLYDFGI